VLLLDIESFGHLTVKSELKTQTLRKKQRGQGLVDNSASFAFLPPDAFVFLSSILPSFLTQFVTFDAIVHRAFGILLTRREITKRAKVPSLKVTSWTHEWLNVGVRVNLLVCLFCAVLMYSVLTSEAIEKEISERPVKVQSYCLTFAQNSF